MSWWRNMTKQKQKRSLEITILVRYLQDCAEQNKVATFTEMSAAIGGLDVQFDYRYLLTKALVILRDDYNKVFKSVMNVGYKLVQNSNVAVHSTRNRQSRIERQTERWGVELGAVNPHRLSGSQLKDYLKCQFKLAGQQLINDCKTQAKLESRTIKTKSYTGLEFAREAAIALADVS